MEDLLFLAHRIPYPPNKGDKIRSYHLLRGLARRYRVHLGAFVDDPDDWRHESRLESLCESVRLEPLRPGVARVRGVLQGFLSGAALSVPYYRSRRMAAWVRARLTDLDCRRIVAFSSPMAQYAEFPGSPVGRRVVVDFVDVDSDKWNQYAKNKRWPASTVYAREARRLFAFERAVAGRSEASVFVSRSEADFFRGLAPDLESKIHAVENGVDTTYFSPAPELPRPFDDDGPVAVFTGAMDYWANVDAVQWFVSHVFGPVREHVPGLRFYIVGSRPTDAVVDLGRTPGVTVTGTVDDVRPYVRYSEVAVAPLRIARGIQNKVLEAMAMARPVIASPQAIDGIELPGDASPVVAETAEQWIESLVAALRSTDGRAVGAGLREAVVRRYGWDEKVDRFAELIA